MSNQKVLEQNIRVWARRLDVEIKNMANASAFANKLCNGNAGRRGAISVVAMVPVSKLLDRRMGDPAVIAASVAIANVIYGVVYKAAVSNIRESFLEEISKTPLSAADVVAVLGKQSEMVALIAKGIAARNSDNSRPNVVGAVLAKVNRKVIRGDHSDDGFM